MRFWTVQSDRVLEIVEKDGIYRPEFAQSPYFKRYHELYGFLLKSFNRINKFQCEGLVFSFCRSDQERIYPIDDIGVFRSLIRLHKNEVVDLWNHFAADNCKILELEMQLNFNDLPLPFHYFQIIMPHPVNDLLYDADAYQEDCALILSKIQEGTPIISGKDNDLIQSHLPYIKRSDIENIYALFDLG